MPVLRELTADLGVVRHVPADRARTAQPWSPRSTAVTVIATATATAQRLLDLHLAGARTHYGPAATARNTQC
ncbi:hypothetical protein GCM10011579_065890 [Streptomyces albiflavescens]|uniref:Uncharacterized protein n=1 Tax=Streptomyces albiflavescens TaxID=1623582 RepID=A0A917YBY8_9ACTN|nr:hypothetical protein [Streptomyces albiflavescens]GGN80405.1 hypothetical protein GCM10011579_065890 [Streptomyces albiflavescens]